MLTNIDTTALNQITTDAAHFTAIQNCVALLNNQDDEMALEKVKASVDALRELVEQQKRLEAACKLCKEITEPALWLIANECGEVNDSKGRKAFKFSKVGKTAKITDNGGLFTRLIANEIPAEKILEACTITPKSAAEMLGLSNKAFEENFAEFIEYSERKPTMKAV